jgi:hypothetical protein
MKMIAEVATARSRNFFLSFCVPHSEGRTIDESRCEKKAGKGRKLSLRNGISSRDCGVRLIALIKERDSD